MSKLSSSIGSRLTNPQNRAESRRQEEELVKEREAAEARLKALEEQVKAGKVRKQEEKRRKQAAEKEAKEKEAKLAAQRAEIEAAKERERQLQLQLESLGDDDDSSDDADTQNATPQENTPTNSQFLIQDPAPKSEIPSFPPSEPSFPAMERSPMTTSPPPAPALAPAFAQPAAYSGETKNPFFKKLSQSSESNTGSASQVTPAVTSPSGNEISTNPFHRMTQQENSTKAPFPLSSTPTGVRPSRVRPEDDDWSVVDSTEDSSDDDIEKPTGGSAKQLASMLFGTMGPPRPLSAMDDKKSPTTPHIDRSIIPLLSPNTQVVPDNDVPPAPPLPPFAPSSNEVPAAPTPPPPMPGSFDTTPAPPAPPPPPPPGKAGGGPPVVGALLGEIVKGKGLRKVETKDRSQSSVAGRVLN